MKKANTSPKHQARRKRALERFHVRQRQDGESEAEYAAYAHRKHEERNSLMSRVG